MKHLKLLSASILIVLVLLLNAANQSPPSTDSASQQSSPAIQSNPDNRPSPIAESDQQKTTRIKQRDNDEKHFVVVSFSPVDVQKDGWDIALIFFTILFTGGLVVVGALQVKWLKKQTKISLISIETNQIAIRVSRQSVEVAQLALRAERPYVFLETQRLNVNPHYTIFSLVDLSPKPTDEFDAKLECVFWNRGKGVARIRGIQIRLLIRPFLPDQSQTTRPVEVGIQRERRSRIVAPSGNMEYSTTFQLQGADWEKLTARPIPRALLIIVGIISYEDVFRGRYRTMFCFDYYSPRKGDKDLSLPDFAGFLMPGSERNNRFT